MHCSIQAVGEVFSRIYKDVLEPLTEEKKMVNSFKHLSASDESGDSDKENKKPDSGMDTEAEEFFSEIDSTAAGSPCKRHESIRVTRLFCLVVRQFAGGLLIYDFRYRGLFYKVIVIRFHFINRIYERKILGL